MTVTRSDRHIAFGAGNDGRLAGRRRTKGLTQIHPNGQDVTVQREFDILHGFTSGLAYTDYGKRTTAGELAASRPDSGGPVAGGSPGTRCHSLGRWRLRRTSGRLSRLTAQSTPFALFGWSGGIHAYDTSQKSVYQAGRVQGSFTYSLVPICECHG